VAESKKFDSYIVIGFNHSGIGSSSVSTTLSNWETPLGICKIDLDLVQSLSANSLVQVEEFSHIYEHSIEVQLPFLQTISNVSFVPLCVSEHCDHKKVAAGIAKAIKELKKRVCIIASSDFTHFGQSYGFMPFKENLRENVEKLDRGAISLIEKMEAQKFLDYVRQTRATICGKDAIALQIETMKAMGARKAQTLKYYTSGDLTGDYANSVSYASIAFY
jgi:AmmeMemoRadiSam system protein B